MTSVRWVGVPSASQGALAGAAGFRLGWTLAFPGNLSRVDAMSAAGRKAAILMTGVVVMLGVAGALEGHTPFLVGMALTGVGHGIYFAVDLALVTDVLPNRYTLLAEGRVDVGTASRLRVCRGAGVRAGATRHTDCEGFRTQVGALPAVPARRLREWGLPVRRGRYLRRGDDGFGPKVTELLGHLPPGVEVIETGIGGVALLQRLGQRRLRIEPGHGRNKEVAVLAHGLEEVLLV